MRGRARADRTSHAQHEIASVLATSLTIADAGPRILATICNHVGWVLGELWRPESSGQVLRRDAFWSADPRVERFAAAIPEGGLGVTHGLAGAAWQEGEAVSIPDLRGVPGLDPRGLAAAGLRSAFGFAIEAAGRPLGVMTFFSREPELPDEQLRRLLQITSRQIAVFIARQQAEEDRDRLHAALLESEQLAAIGQTAACLAHEISNPLSGMYVAAQLMQRRLGSVPDPDPRLVQTVARMMSENRRLNTLLEEFRSLSQRQIIARVPTDVREVVEDVIAMQQTMLEDSGIRPAIDIPESIPLVSLDGAKLTQVLLNLTKNAAEAMESAGGVLTLRARLTGPTLVVEVQDTGPGIPEGVDVFEPFRTTKAKGTGLGLPIARQILAAHDGVLEYESDRQKGTTFRIVLPATDPSGPGTD
jgi:signal transduction histidine kinase